MNVKKNPLRKEIQGLRVIAVFSVLIYHVWPSALSGGYVGVDVFFVISGFLITGLLLKEVERHGRISLSKFYSKRIRRLLPAATAVLLFVALISPLLPTVQLLNTAYDILASALYVQNWWLADQAINYLAEGSAPSLLQHYWSLAVEEQYYILWPLLFWFTSLILRAKQLPTKIIFTLIILVIGLLSLAYSIYATAKSPEIAYFSTATRMWELALGGLLAIWSTKIQIQSAVLRSLISWLGIVFIGIACVTFDYTTAFPGYSALLPTLGAALLILGADNQLAWSSYGVLKSRVVQYLGDTSYSLYLWHWPIILLYKTLNKGEMGVVEGLMIIAISIAVASGSKFFIEDPFRVGTDKTHKIFTQAKPLAITCILLSVLAAVGVWSSYDYAKREATSRVFSLDEIKAMSLAEYDVNKPLVPDPVFARYDNPDVYRLDCHANKRTTDTLHCEFGAPNAENVMVLVGDSQAAQWLPALQQLIVEDKSWRIITFTKSACSFSDTPIAVGRDKRLYSACNEWNQNVLTAIKNIKPNLIVTSQSIGYKAFYAKSAEESLQLMAAGYASRWNKLAQLSVKLAVVQSIPMMKQDVPECMSAPSVTIQGCSTERSTAFRPDAVLMAMENEPKLELINMSDLICEPEVCKPVKGQVLIWRDYTHVTATFARLLYGEFRFLLKP